MASFPYSISQLWRKKSGRRPGNKARITWVLFSDDMNPILWKWNLNLILWLPSVSLNSLTDYWISWKNSNSQSQCSSRTMISKPSLMRDCTYVWDAVVETTTVPWGNGKVLTHDGSWEVSGFGGELWLVFTLFSKFGHGEHQMMTIEHWTGTLDFSCSSHFYCTQDWTS